MEKRFKLATAVLLLVTFLCATSVSAASCDNETKVRLSKDATNVKATYEASEIGTGKYEESETYDDSGNPISYEITEPRVVVSLLNITNELYVEVKSSLSSETKTYKYSDSADGVISFQALSDTITNYTFTVFAADSNCYGEKLYSFNLTTPKYNSYYSYDICNGINEYYCKEFTTVDITMTYDEVVKDIESKYDLTSKKPKEEVKETFFGKYGVLIICASVVVIVGVAALVFVNRNKRSKIK